MSDELSDKPANHSTGQHSASGSWDGPSIFRATQLTFDPGDKANGSLYLCDPSGGRQSQAIERAIAMLRERALWSAQDPKQVRDDQRQAYEEQLVFVEALEVVVGGARIVITRCNHPKFPSSAERFSGWKNALGAGT